MCIGPRENFESVIISLPEKGERTSQGSEIVAFSRDTDILALAICDTNGPISLEKLKNIGTEMLLKSKHTLFCGIV